MLTVPLALDAQVILFHQSVLPQLLRRTSFKRDPAVHNDVAPVCDFDRLMEILLGHQHGEMVLLLEFLNFRNRMTH